MKLLYPVLVAMGAVIGALVGILTRPTYLGIQMPLGLLTSPAPIDAPFKADLTNHLLLTTGIGLVVGIVLALVVAVLLGRRAVEAAPSVTASASYKGLVLFSAGATAITLVGYLILPERAFSLLFVCMAVLSATAGVTTIFLETSKAGR